MTRETTNENTVDLSLDQPDTAETSGITRLSKTDDETEGQHLKRVAEELSGSGEHRVSNFKQQLSARESLTRLAAAAELGRIGTQRSVQVLRELLSGTDRNNWALAVHGLRSGGSREAWLCLESVAQAEAGQINSVDSNRSSEAVDRLLAMGRTKMMDRLFRAADGHSRSIPADVAIKFSKSAVGSLADDQRMVMELRLGLNGYSASTPRETADSLSMELDKVRALELKAWQTIHSPLPAPE